MAQRYAADQLVEFTTRLFASAGLDGDKAATTATLLVEADLMGHTTHGLQLAGAYLREIEAGRMAVSGAPTVVADRGPTLTWDGGRLPGVCAGRYRFDRPGHGIEIVAKAAGHPFEPSQPDRDLEDLLEIVLHGGAVGRGRPRRVAAEGA